MGVFGKEVFVQPRLKAGFRSVMEMLGVSPLAWFSPARSLHSPSLGWRGGWGITEYAGQGQSFPQRPSSHTGWGSQMLTSLHICTTAAPKASLIYHPRSCWDAPASSKRRVSASSEPSHVLPLIPASVFKGPESPEHSPVPTCPFLDLLSTSRSPSHTRSGPLPPTTFLSAQKETWVQGAEFQSGYRPIRVTGVTSDIDLGQGLSLVPATWGLAHDLGLLFL